MGGKRGPFYLKINSKEIEGEEFELKTDNFGPLETFIIEKDVVSVGEPNRLQLRMSNDDGN